MFLSESQLRAVRSESPLIAVIAAAGSGKTFTLLERIYHLVHNKGVNSARVKVITFTRKAAGEVAERLEKLNIEGVRADTFHSFCYALINGYATRLGYRYPVNAYDEHLSASILVDIMISHQLPHRNPAQNEKLRTATVKVIRNAVERILLNEPDAWIKIDEEYNNRLKAYNAVDYAKMITETTRLLRDNEDVRAEIHNTWHHFMVDEFQDTSPDQMELIDLIDPKNLFIIGDFDQSIYAWRGATPENINKVVSTPGCELIHLDTNYRCSTSVITHSNALISHNRNELRVEAKPAEDAEMGQCVAFGGHPDVWTWAAQKAQELIRSKRYKARDITILCRDNGREHYPVGCYGVTQVLKRAGIPFKRVVRDGSVWESYEVRNMIYTLNLIMNPKDKASWSMAVDFPFRRTSQANRVNIKKYATHERMNLLDATTHSELYTINDNEPLISWTFRIIDLIKMWGDLHELEEDCIPFFTEVVSKMGWYSHFRPLVGPRFHFTVELIKHQMRTLANEGYPGLLNFIEWWLSRESTRESPHRNAVEVSTIHSYKGLQNKVIIIPGVDLDYFPKMNKKSLNLAEEVRIFYVGITRTEDECYVLFGEEPSQFVGWADLLGVADASEDNDYLRDYSMEPI